MYRDILFRGRPFGSTEWLTGDLLTFAGSDKLMIRSFDDDGNENVEEVDPATVGQYCGYLDHDSEPVFEGDKVHVYQLRHVEGNRWPMIESYSGHIAFTQGAFCIVSDFEGEEGRTHPLFMFLFAHEPDELEHIIRPRRSNRTYPGLVEYIMEFFGLDTRLEASANFGSLLRIGNIYDNPDQGIEGPMDDYEFDDNED